MTTTNFLSSIVAGATRLYGQADEALTAAKGKTTTYFAQQPAEPIFISSIVAGATRLYGQADEALTAAKEKTTTYFVQQPVEPITSVDDRVGYEEPEAISPIVTKKIASTPYIFQRFDANTSSVEREPDDSEPVSEPVVVSSPARKRPTSNFFMEEAVRLERAKSVPRQTDVVVVTEKTGKVSQIFAKLMLSKTIVSGSSSIPTTPKIEKQALKLQDNTAYITTTFDEMFNPEERDRMTEIVAKPKPAPKKSLLARFLAWLFSWK